MEKGISQVALITPAMNGRAPSARSKPQPRRRASEGISDSSAEGGGGDSFQEPGGTDLDFIGWDHGVRESTSRIRGPVHRSSAERAAFAAGTTGMARRTTALASKTSDIDMWKGGEDGTDTDVGPGSAGFGMGLGVGVRTSPTKGAEGDVSRKKYLLESELNSADSTPRALADARSRERWRRADEKDARAERSGTTTSTGVGLSQRSAVSQHSSYITDRTGSGSINIRPAAESRSYDAVRARIARGFESRGPRAAVEQTPSAMDISRRSSADDKRVSRGGAIPARQLEPKRKTPEEVLHSSSLVSGLINEKIIDEASRIHEQKVARNNDGRRSENGSESDASFENSIPSEPQSLSALSSTSSAPPVRESWSVRIRLKAIAGLPSSSCTRTPHSLPCQLLKFGIICAKEKFWEKSFVPGASIELDLLTHLNKKGLDSIPRSHTRCSSHRILTPRDNGSLEFDEEMRWDDVVVAPKLSDSDVAPAGFGNVVVVVELCARNVLDSPPILSSHERKEEEKEESGPGSNSQGLRKNALGEFELGDFTSSQRGKSPQSSVPSGNRSNSNEDAFWSRRSASSVSGGPRHATMHGSDSALEGQIVDGKVSRRHGDKENVTSDYSPTRKAFSKDLRIGNVTIPLTDLPMEDVRRNHNGEAVVEKWFPLNSLGEGCESMQASAAPTKAVLTGVSGRSSTLRAASVTQPSPSILLEVSFCRAEALDISENKADIHDDVEDNGVDCMADSTYGKKATDAEANEGSKDKQKKGDIDPVTGQAIDPRMGPLVKPGVIDFIAVIGCRDIGDQANDDGSPGWVESIPECSVLEQFPNDDAFHAKHGRNVMLADKIEWFCFPEGARLWRGDKPPTHKELNLNQFNASASPSMASTTAAFDSCLNCSCSFSWFVMASNSDEYGSNLLKTYGAVIRFFVSAPTDIDQARAGSKRLWVPFGILITSSLPIVGVLEAMLLRTCETFAAKSNAKTSVTARQLERMICQDIADIIVNWSAPISGILHCSVPFLSGPRYHLTLPPPTGLPALPHGGSVTSVCRLLGADGLTVLLAAVLTESKILIHSAHVANLAMVGEVITALIYPFQWSLPYVPVLPIDMMEFIEAPLSYFLGVPSCNLQYIDKEILYDVVVVDIDNGLSPDFFDGRRMRATKLPMPLPASISSNISKAVFRLIKEEDRVTEDFAATAYFSSRHLPRLETESLAEREFRVAVAIQICSLLRGYQECLFFVSASQPVFNRDRFLRNAPALFEERRTTLQPKRMSSVKTSTKESSLRQSHRILSPRAKRFLSNLVNTQHFHVLLEFLDHDSVAIFHEIMDIFDRNFEGLNRDASVGIHGSNNHTNLAGISSRQLEQGAKEIYACLEKAEAKICTYRVDRDGDKEKKAKRLRAMDNSGGYISDEEDAFAELMNQRNNDEEDVLYQVESEKENTYLAPFTQFMLKSAQASDMSLANRPNDADGHGVQRQSLNGTNETKTMPWEYVNFLQLLDKAGNPVKGKGGSDAGEENYPLDVQLANYPTLKEAIGERKFRKLKQEQKIFGEGEEIEVMEEGDTLDITKLLSFARVDSSLSSQRPMNHGSVEQQRVNDAKDRDILRRCLEMAYSKASRRAWHSNLSDQPSEAGIDEHIITEAEQSLRNSSAQQFLISVLSQRKQLDNQRRKGTREEAHIRGPTKQSNTSVSRLEPSTFDCVVRLCVAMLEACNEEQYYEGAYQLLQLTAGIYTTTEKSSASRDKADSGETIDLSNVVYMTARIGSHPIYADLRLWERVLLIHRKDKGSGVDREGVDDSSRPSSDGPDGNEDVDEYEAAVSTLYEMLAYGMAAEDLGNFAMRVSEERGWFDSERGRALLVLARRISAKRDDEKIKSGLTARGLSDLTNPHLETITGRSDQLDPRSDLLGYNTSEKTQNNFIDIAWSHPAGMAFSPSEPKDNAKSTGHVLQPVGSVGRAAITSLTSFGPHVVATGGLDGSIFLAHTIKNRQRDEDSLVSGAFLEWGVGGARGMNVGSTSSAIDGEFGVGAVSCLAAVRGPGYRNAGSASNVSRKDSNDTNEMGLLAAMDGCRIIGGTTGGDLRVWSVKDVYASTIATSHTKGDATAAAAELLTASSVTNSIYQHSSGTTSTFSRGANLADTNSSAVVRLKSPVKGRALSGHRGGVTCLDVPSHIYRPDSVVSGGNDGLIKLWSLRQQPGRRSVQASQQRTSLDGTGQDSSSAVRERTALGTEAVEVLTGHEGKVITIKTAWHGDHLVSGGADRSARLWDLAGGGGKCVHSLKGHLGWVSQAHYWGPQTIVTGSTDRTIALWDARIGSKPLFILRHHLSPVSDILVGSRTEYNMVSTGQDGSVATWDFRTVSGAGGKDPTTTGSGSARAIARPVGGRKFKTRTVRVPTVAMKHKGVHSSGAVLLCRGAAAQERSVISASIDGKLKEWDVINGRILDERRTGHTDIISCLSSFAGSDGLIRSSEASNLGGTISCSWDGTVRMRRLLPASS